jgi:hypothetical protein
MSAKKSELLSTWGILWEIARVLVNAVLDRGGSDEDLRRILSDKKMLADLADRIMAVPPAKFLVATYKVMIDYGRSIVDSVKAGKYDWVNEAITDANFPNTEFDQVGGEKEIGLFHFKRNISSEDVIASMKAEGFRPATMRELLGFGEHNPELQREFPIVALGQVAVLGGRRRVGFLRRGGSGRYASLGYFGFGWDDICRFLAVRI